jgi:pimeloyl-ACP methyl ester carboxylesterase
VTGSASAKPHDCDGDDEYTIVDIERTVVAQNLERTVAIVQVGEDSVNRFPMYRVRRGGPGHASRGTIFLLPPISNGFENYEVSDTGEYERSFVAYFASRGYDVWGLSQRTALLTVGDCESGAYDCSAMADWGLQTLIEDAEFVREQIQWAHPGQRPVIGGVSLGSIGALAALNADPHDYAGAILMEGTIYNADPGEQAIAQTFCTQFQGALAAGGTYDDQQLPGLKSISALASFAPADPSPIPAFAGLTNHQAYVAAMSTPQIGPLTPRPGYFFLNGNPGQDHFLFASDALARNNMATFSDYVSLRMIRDVDCGLAGERTHTAKLSRFQGPVFVSAGEHGFGRAMLDTVDIMPRARATVGFYPGYGHMDYFFSVDHRRVMESAIQSWLESDVFHH